MLDFIHYVPTKVFFGREKQKEVGKILKEYKVKKVLLVFSDVPFLRPLYDQVEASLNEQNIPFVEFDRVMPNPELSLVHEGIKVCRENGADFILAIGGGSAIDAAKGIAVGVPYDGEVWDFYEGKVTDTALPLAAILTIPATGSECDSGSVITNAETGLKRCANFPALFPRFAILNPELTFTLPPIQTAAGLADMYVHISEQYFTNTKNTCVIDNMEEACFKALVNIGPKIMENPTDYDLRSESMWIATIAQNGNLGVGREQDWGTHYLGHEISAKYGSTHGITMAILHIAWMKYVYQHDLDRFVRYGKNVFDVVTEGKSKEKIALEAIERNAAFYQSLGLPMKLSEIGVKKEDFEELANSALQKNAFLAGDYLGAFVPLYKKDLIKILESAY